ncbi:MAG: hypothetical protein Ta2G_19190 [Termitinemataceae bacterium]|nr:MAG: hypothetical protein Ta2G_19190 [Termitinemataceae bacterium]
MLSLQQAFIWSFAMGVIIFLCRLAAFIFFRGDLKMETSDIRLNKSASAKQKFLKFVELTAPPVAMTVLTFNDIAAQLRKGFSLLLPAQTLSDCAPVVIACILTALLHIVRGNSLLSIFCGTAAFMVLSRLF